MKVLVATFTYAPNVDGVAEASRLMVENFRNAGHEVRVATGKAAHAGEVPAETQSGIYRFEISGAPIIGIGFQGEIDEYRDFVMKYDPDVIVCHCWDTWPSELLIPLLPAIRAKSVLLSHGYTSHLLNPRILPRGLWKWLRSLPHNLALPLRLRHFDRVVFLSHKQDWKRFIDVRIANLTGANNILTIPNGVPELPCTRPGAFRERHEIGDGTFLLCIANYTGRKNQERALISFAKALLPEATLVFIGSELGKYGQRIVRLWQKLESEGSQGRVLFLEGLKRDETISALRDCDIKVLAADAETQPIVILEAMAAGKPFISTNTGCVEEFDGGIIVENAEQMAAAMRSLAGSAAERRELGEKGRRDYEAHYRLACTSSQWLKCLDDLSAES